MKKSQLLELGTACVTDALFNGHDAAVDEGLIALLKLRMLRESGEHVDVEFKFQCLDVASGAVEKAIACLERLGSRKFDPTETSIYANSFSASNEAADRK